MARLSYLDKDTMSPEAAMLLESRPSANLFRILAHSPAALGGFLAFGDGLREHSELDGRLRELVILRVGALCDAEYEMHQHKRIGRARGLSEAKIAAATRQGPETVLDSFEQDVMRFTDAVVLEVKAPGPLYESVASRFRERQTLELVMTIGYYCMVCRMLETLQIDIEPDGVL